MYSDGIKIFTKNENEQKHIIPSLISFQNSLFPMYQKKIKNKKCLS